MSTTPHAILTRFAYSPMGTFGKLLLPSGMELYTVEDPWKENKPRESCIPEGEYWLQPRRFNAGGYMTTQVVGVPNRDLILVHIANTEIDVMGCIGVGTGLSFLKERWAIRNSAGAFEKYIKEMGGKTGRLSIVRYLPPNMSPVPLATTAPRASP